MNRKSHETKNYILEASLSETNSMATSLGRQLPNPHLGTIIMSLMFKHVLPSEDSQKKHLLYCGPNSSLVHVTLYSGDYEEKLSE